MFGLVKWVGVIVIGGAGVLVGCGEAEGPPTEAENTIEGTSHHGHDHDHDGHGHDHAGHNAAEQLQDAAGEAQQKTMEMLDGAAE